MIYENLSKYRAGKQTRVTIPKGFCTDVGISGGTKLLCSTMQGLKTLFAHAKWQPDGDDLGEYTVQQPTDRSAFMVLPSAITAQLEDGDWILFRGDTETGMIAIVGDAV